MVFRNWRFLQRKPRASLISSLPLPFPAGNLVLLSWYPKILPFGFFCLFVCLGFFWVLFCFLFSLLFLSWKFRSCPRLHSATSTDDHMFLELSCSFDLQDYFFISGKSSGVSLSISPLSFVGLLSSGDTYYAHTGAFVSRLDILCLLSSLCPFYYLFRSLPCGSDFCIICVWLRQFFLGSFEFV